MEYNLHDFHYMKSVTVHKDYNFGFLYSQESYLQLVFETSIISPKLGKDKPVLKHKELNDFPKATWWSISTVSDYNAKLF